MVFFYRGGSALLSCQKDLEPPMPVGSKSSLRTPLSPLLNPTNPWTPHLSDGQYSVAVVQSSSVIDHHAPHSPTTPPSLLTPELSGLLFLWPLPIHPEKVPVKMMNSRKLQFSCKSNSIILFDQEMRRIFIDIHGGCFPKDGHGQGHWSRCRRATSQVEYHIGMGKGIPLCTKKGRRRISSLVIILSGTD